MKLIGISNWRIKTMVDKIAFYQIKENVFINLMNMSHVEILDSSNPPEKYAALYFLRTQNGDRLFLNKKEFEKFSDLMKKYSA